MSLYDLQDVCIAIGSIATLDLPMVVDLIGIYGLKGPYCTLTTTDWFLQALSVIPMGSWGDVARRFTMIRWTGLLVQPEEGVSDLVVDRIGVTTAIYREEPDRKSRSFEAGRRPPQPPASAVRPPHALRASAVRPPRSSSASAVRCLTAHRALAARIVMPRIIKKRISRVRRRRFDIKRKPVEGKLVPAERIYDSVLNYDYEP
ncbi:acyl-CoA dehydrogenase-related protein [Dorcoceras hygrometricum]|uniref:Acyl-CoA dehydrogenase-related protein n=1 Tax=Dorcoceras hygrometricum TaxID=472368 RepID=A0A2Z7BH17_9LAMI|nr:acyl-CoA dehydrogenase-related protein [Dorcoceras hygrometricum]